MRLWILVGANLLSVARIARVVGVGDHSLAQKVSDTTAGGLIFGSAGRWLRRSLDVVLLTMLVSGLWFAMSFTVVPSSACSPSPAGLLRAGGDTIAKLHVMDGLQGLVKLIVMAFVGATLLRLPIVFANQTQNPAMCFPQLLGTSLDGSLAILVSASLVFIVIVWAARRANASNPRSVADRFLAAYGLDDAIFREHGLRSFLAEIFDPDWLRRASMTIARWNAALDGHASLLRSTSAVRNRRAHSRISSAGEASAQGTDSRRNRRRQHGKRSARSGACRTWPSSTRSSLPRR